MAALFLSDNNDSRDNHICSFQRAGQFGECPLDEIEFTLKVVQLYLRTIKHGGILACIFLDRNVSYSPENMVMLPPLLEALTN
jgi:hypothetical protein